jgi:hypothetical protein
VEHGLLRNDDALTAFSFEGIVADHDVRDGGFPGREFKLQAIEVSAVQNSNP